eukprot:7381702-Prymnesium_polylepis.1
MKSPEARTAQPVWLYGRRERVAAVVRRPRAVGLRVEAVAVELDVVLNVDVAAAAIRREVDREVGRSASLAHRAAHHQPGLGPSHTVGAERDEHSTLKRSGGLVLLATPPRGRLHKRAREEAHEVLAVGMAMDDKEVDLHQRPPPAKTRRVVVLDLQALGDTPSPPPIHVRTARPGSSREASSRGRVWAGNLSGGEGQRAKGGASNGAQTIIRAHARAAVEGQRLERRPVVYAITAASRLDGAASTQNGSVAAGVQEELPLEAHRRQAPIKLAHRVPRGALLRAARVVARDDGRAVGRPRHVESLDGSPNQAARHALDSPLKVAKRAIEPAIAPAESDHSRI